MALQRLHLGAAIQANDVVGFHRATRRDRRLTGFVRRRFGSSGFWGAAASQIDSAFCIARVTLEIVKRSDDLKGFHVLPRRWVVERTFSWFGRNRRLAKDFENLAETVAAFVALASIQLAIRRLARA